MTPIGSSIFPVASLSVHQKERERKIESFEPGLKANGERGAEGYHHRETRLSMTMFLLVRALAGLPNLTIVGPEPPPLPVNPVPTEPVLVQFVSLTSLFSRIAPSNQ